MKRLSISILVILLLATTAYTQPPQPFVLTGVVTDGNKVYSGLFTIKIVSKSVYDTFYEETVWFEQLYNNGGSFRFDIPFTDRSNCYEAYVIVEVLSGTGSSTRQQLTLPELYMCSGQSANVALITVNSVSVNGIRGVSPVYPYNKLDMSDVLYMLRVLSGNNLPSPPGG